MLYLQTSLRTWGAAKIIEYFVLCPSHLADAARSFFQVSLDFHPAQMMLSWLTIAAPSPFNLGRCMDLQELDLMYQDCQLGQHSKVVGGRHHMLLYKADNANNGLQTSECTGTFESLELATEALQRQLLLDAPELRSVALHLLLGGNRFQHSPKMLHW